MFYHLKPSSARTIALGVILVLLTCLTGAAAQSLAPLPLLEQCAERRADGDISALVSELGNRSAGEAARVATIGKLGQSCAAGAVGEAQGLLGDPAPAVRAAAIEALGRLGDPESIDPLIDQIGQIGVGPPEVGVALVRSLISFKSNKARSAVVNGIIHPLNRPVVGEGDMRIRAIALLTLNELPNTAYNRKSIGFLFEIQQSKDPAVVKIAEEALGLLPKTRNGAREMVGIIRNNNIPSIRTWMCQWIGKLGIEEGRESLTEIAASDPNQQTRAAAAEALKRLGLKRVE